MKGHFLQYRFVDLNDGQGAGSHRHAQFGCDGVYHVIAFTEAEVDAQGAVIAATGGGFEQLGLCDASCAAGMKDRTNDGAGFMYEYDTSLG